MRSKLFWVGVLYFSEGLPYGVFYDVFPVWFRERGVDLQSIGVLSLLGLSWSLKFLWAPLLDQTRHHRWWMAAVDLAMAGVMVAFALQQSVGPAIWLSIGLFTLLSATNDIAVDGYTIELLDKQELGVANGVRNGLYRAGLLVAGALLTLSDKVGWSAAFGLAALMPALCAGLVLLAPREPAVERPERTALAQELQRIVCEPRLAAGVLALGLAVLWLIDRALRWSQTHPALWWIAFAVAFTLLGMSALAAQRVRAAGVPRADPRDGPLFGALLELIERPGVWPVLAFILLFKLGDQSMGFMVKPFWKDAGFTNNEIGLVSVNVGIVLSLAGGLLGGWYTDRAGIFRGLWVLGLFQALSNLGYAAAASLVPYTPQGVGLAPDDWQRAVVYGASAAESFTGGVGTGAFLAFLMAIVDRRHAAAGYALLSSLFAFARALAGYASGFGAEAFGYGPYFLLTFFLSFPAYLLLSHVSRMLEWSERRATAGDAQLRDSAVALGLDAKSADKDDRECV